VGRQQRVRQFPDRDLVQPTVEVARVIGAVAKANLSQRMALEIEGDRWRRIPPHRPNRQHDVEQLGSFASR